ncbi:MAG TPA: glycosyl hydrolase 115 family protein [Terracidiphilus sp.]|nr:glycosyl hydrolase 115 family protein [Terracidiphilus sp.]
MDSIRAGLVFLRLGAQIRRRTPRVVVRLALLASLAIAFRPHLSRALGEPKYVHTTPVAGGFTLAASGQAAPLLVSDQDWPGVLRAAGDLSQDIDRVTGHASAIVKDAAQARNEIVIIGTIGKSPLIDALIRRHKLDVSGIAGQWESEVTTIVDHPLHGVPRALVIAGADKRGTIYGIYDLSEQIGVSPWYWWADVRVPHADALYVDPGRVVQPVPAVKYRGIFFNDEAPALSGWTTEKFGGMNHEFYTKVFELLLRLKANFLWPAMWNNAFATDDPLNPKLADEYGIVMGTSHEEPMMRAEKEWDPKVDGAWDYTTNQEKIDEFWRGAMERDKNYEEVVTLGMRGHNDTPMSESGNIDLLERIVADQREILKQTVNPDVTKVPQVWALYKEVQGYYEKGMRVPDDVTLLWSDDNWGNLRRLPTPEERKRSGGAGIYYHFDYVGGPRSYKWLNTNPIPKVQEQLNLALAYGADRLWVVNVGDGKPMEFPMEFFLSYARTPKRWDKDHLDEYTKLWAAREFGPEHADEIAGFMEDYTRYNGRRKPELIDPSTFSLDNYGDADRVDGEWRWLADGVDTLAKQLPEDELASYFELIQYPVDASANLTEMYIMAAENAADARIGNPGANAAADRVLEMFQKDADLSDEYNHKLLNGKWDHMMDQTHIGYTFWNEPAANTMPAITRIQVRETGSLGIMARDATFDHASGHFVFPLSPFDMAVWQSQGFSLFDRGKGPVSYTIEPSEPWLEALPAHGTIGPGRPPYDVDSPPEWIKFIVNWKIFPDDFKAHEANVTIRSGDQKLPTYTFRVERVPKGTPSEAHGFIERDGYVSIEAADTSARTADGDTHWEELPGYGITRSAMTIYPVTAASDTDSKASLEYRMYLYDSGDFQLEATLAPTQGFIPGRGLRFAVSVDEGPRTIVDELEHNTQADWAKAVSDSVRRVTVPLTIASPGAHAIHIWAVDPGVVLERIVVSHGPLKPSYLGPPESPRFPEK